MTEEVISYKWDNPFIGFFMINSNILAEILVLKRYKKKGLGEKSLFDLLMGFKNKQYLDLFTYLFEFRADYGFSEEEIQKLSKESALFDNAKRIIAICNDLNIQISTCLDENYPSIFIKMRSLPIFFYKGDLNLLNGRNIAIVGTRNPTSYGVNITERIVKVIGSNVSIVSGGAMGIDTVAHSSAIKYGSKTIVFFGTSIDNPYPSNNIPLFNKIVEEGGLIISAFGPLEETNEFTFVKRNQYIAEVSQAVIVVEGGEKSGARLTAEYAFEKGIPVFAVPGPITSEKSYCPNYLISKGGRILYSESVISEFLGLQSNLQGRVMPQPDFELNEDENKILSCLSQKSEMHIDEILLGIEKSAAELNELLLKMELKGVIEQLPGKFYKKRSY